MFFDIDLIDSPANFSPSVLKVSMQGVSQVVELWKAREELGMPKINGNTILNMYGSWMFDAALIEGHG